jgi:hypothetical protein
MRRIILIQRLERQIVQKLAGNRAAVGTAVDAANRAVVNRYAYSN